LGILHHRSLGYVRIDDKARRKWRRRRGLLMPCPSFSLSLEVKSLVLLLCAGFLLAFNMVINGRLVCPVWWLLDRIKAVVFVADIYFSTACALRENTLCRGLPSPGLEIMPRLLLALGHTRAKSRHLTTEN
jgi:hypothetical protein